ncbi:MAG TPA: hypothetical protein PLA77_03510, partial [Bacteroidales bacterium]|nr:hypothetical protein [Bacteroidales bacterium]
MKRFLQIACSILVALVISSNLQAQITANGASGSFPTTYSQGFLNNGGTNDLVYVFCGTQDQPNIGSLTVSAAGCTVAWYVYDGISFVPNGQTGVTANNLATGCYMARVTCGGNVTCYRAWVWVNQSYVEVNPIAPGCQTFTLQGSAQVLDNQFTINDPPGSNFQIDANTYIKVCFWATHTYVSDIGFYLKSPGNQPTEPPNPGVVQLCPAASDWGPLAEQGSWTGIPWTTLGCSDPSEENTVCNSGNNVTNFCFATHTSPGGTVLPAGNPTYTPCVCDLPTPLTGTFGSVGPWSTIYGSNAADPGWSVQIYDCEAVDVGSLTRATITFIGQTECGQASFVYDSGTINSAINDNSCSASTASLYVVPPGAPAGTYTVSSQIVNQEWTCSALPGWTSNTLSTQIVAGSGDFPPSTCNYTLTVYEQVNVPGNIICSTSASRLFETMPADATITPLSPMCTNSAPVQLDAEDGGGTWTCTTAPAAIENGVFYPDVAGPGNHTITYAIVGPCSDNDQISVTVYDDITVSNFVDTCNTTNTQYIISFSVTGSQGNPAPFMANWGSGFQPFTGTFLHAFTSGTIYNITVTDANMCSEYVFSGYHYCDCETNAGSMVSLEPLLLCANECTGTNQHNGDHTLDGDDMLEFIIHNGAYPPTIYARNNTTNFCMNSIPGGAQFNVTYYISAIAGNNVGGHVDVSDICYNQAIGRPVVWYPIPIAHINGTELDTCGLSIHLSADPPGDGMLGYWSADAQFVPLNGTSVSSPEIDVLVNDYADVTFTWTVTNTVCSGTDQILVHFRQTPNAYAGADVTVCGTCMDLGAVLSLPTSNGQWSGNGVTFDQSTNPNTQACVSNYGTYILTWSEFNGDCFDQDNVAITFVQEPTPSTTLNHDTVCGVTYQLHVYNNNFPGQWRAYDDGVQINPTYINGTSSTNPHAQVVIPAYVGLHNTVVFEWTEVSQYGSLQCFGTASITVTFAREPAASVGEDDHDQTCGNIYTFAADTLGSGWAYGTWVASHLIATYDDINDPFATVTIDPLGSFGDSAYVQAAFLWVMNNTGCTAIDTMYVTFYQAPVANAGINDSICGFEYPLHSYYSIDESDAYSPTGWWIYHDGPVTQGVNIADQNSPETNVTVPVEGTYRFVWRESNSLLPSCYTTDTVEIKFIEIPVIDAGDDFNVCGQCTTLNCTGAGYPGSWQPMSGITWGDPTDPHTTICSQTYGPRQFIWQETNGMCFGRDTVIVNFWRVPTAEILTDEADSTQCGLCFTRLQAGIPGTGISGHWWDANEPNAVFTAVNVNTPDSVCVTQY